MLPDPFGDFHRDGKAGWLGHPELPRFAALGARAAGPGPGLEDPAVASRRLAELQELHAQAMQQVRSRLGPDAAPVFRALDEQRAELLAGAARGPDPEQAAEAARHAAEMAAHAQRLRDGRFPVRVIAPKEARPAPEQEAAFRHLVDHQAEVRRAVLAALYESYQQYYKDERWRFICDLKAIDAPEGLAVAAHLEDVEVVREQRDGVAFLVFHVDCEWEVEHGMYVVYHPATGAAWTTYDGLEDLIGAELYDEDEDEDEDEDDDAPVEVAPVRAAPAAGRIGRHAPLVSIVEQLDVDQLGQLLAAGADANSREYGGKTALERARELHEEYTQMINAPPPEGVSPLIKAGMAFSVQVRRRDLPKIEEMIRLLEAAGAS